MIYTHVMQDGPCGIKSPLTRVRRIQQERSANRVTAKGSDIADQRESPAILSEEEQTDNGVENHVHAPTHVGRIQQPRRENVGLIFYPRAEPVAPRLRAACRRCALVMLSFGLTLLGRRSL